MSVWHRIVIAAGVFVLVSILARLAAGRRRRPAGRATVPYCAELSVVRRGGGADPPEHAAREAGRLPRHASATTHWRQGVGSRARLAVPDRVY